MFTDPIRFGWWAVSQNGSPTKVGEFQSLQSSPFYDLDTLITNGTETLDLTITGMDNEANNAHARYYGPGMKANVQFQRFLRQLDHDPLQGFAATPPGTVPANNVDVVTTDLNLGQDYAIRVEQLDARFSGPIGDEGNVKWKMNLWGMRKFGERQANAVAHCFNFNAPNSAALSQNVVCHVVSQRQTIDWLTMEMQPGLEATFGAVSVEYTKTLRTFGQADGIVDRQYTRFNFSGANNVLGPDYNYAMTPENFTHIDRLKLSTQLTPGNMFYSNLYVGQTHNENRDTHREYNGWDLRLINTSRDDLTLTAYSSNYEENNELPTTFLNAPPLSSPNGWDQSQVRHPIDYQRLRAGINGRWKPYDQDSRFQNLSWKGGYEYYLIARDYATYDSARLGVFTQPDTHNHLIELGPTMQWNRALSTYITYKGLFSQVPLIGVRESSGKLNTNQPEQSHRVDLGGTWQPTSTFMATAQFSAITSWQNSQYADFLETSYPLTMNLWWAPTDRWSLSGGYAYFTNWIDQDIGIGFRTTPYESQQWNYSGQNQLVSANTSYALTSSMRLTGGYEWNRGSNIANIPASISGADWSQLASYFDVEAVTQRYSAGVDWQPYDNMDLYLRYNYFDYSDMAANVDSGTAHMALAGISYAR